MTVSNRDYLCEVPLPILEDFMYLFIYLYLFIKTSIAGESTTYMYTIARYNDQEIISFGTYIKMT